MDAFIALIPHKNYIEETYPEITKVAKIGKDTQTTGYIVTIRVDRETLTKLKNDENIHLEASQKLFTNTIKWDDF
jgi:hypothetical protein